jgi:hypothetical protein
MIEPDAVIPKYGLLEAREVWKNDERMSNPLPGPLNPPIPIHHHIMDIIRIGDH